MGWSSAITMRIGALLLSIGFMRKADLQPRAFTRVRFDNQLALDGAQPFYDNSRASADLGEFIVAQAPGEVEGAVAPG